MKKYVLLFIVVCFLPAFFGMQILVGQNPLVKQWDKRFGGTEYEWIKNFYQLPDRGFILAGTSNSGNNGDKTQPLIGGLNYGDFWIVRTDSLGVKQWDRTFGGDMDETNCSFQPTLDGGFILGGTSFSGISGNKSEASKGNSDYWVVKTDSLGIQQWDKTIGGSSGDNLCGLQQTKDGGFILGGTSNSEISGDKTQGNWDPNNQMTDYWIVKLDSMGNKQWDKTFGGVLVDVMKSLDQTADGGYILGGYSGSTISGDKSEMHWDTTFQPLYPIPDYWIIKIDSSGNKQWDKVYGGFNQDKLECILQTPDGGYIMGGLTKSEINGNKTKPLWGGDDYWIVKTDSAGNYLWDKDLGGTSADYFHTINLTKGNGFLFCGVSGSGINGDKSENNLGGSQAWIIKADSMGNKIWDKTIQSNIADFYSNCRETSNGSYTITSSSDSDIGGEKSEATRGYVDYWIIKFQDTTYVAYTPVNISSSDTTFCDKQYIDFFDQSTNNPTSWQWLFPGGTPSSSTLQNPVGIYYNSYGSFDVTLIACNASGCDTLFLPNFINELQGPPVPVVIWIADTLFSTPAFSYQWYFNSTIIPGATSQYYVFQQPGDYFVIITDSNGCAVSSTILFTAVNEIGNANGGIYVVPNPTDGNFVLVGAKVNSVVGIYDVAGRVLYSSLIKSLTERIQVNLADGIYFLKIEMDDKFVVKKMVVRH